MDTTIKKITGLLLILGTLSLLYWPRVYHEGFFIPLRFDLIFLAAVLFFGIYFLRECWIKEISLNREDLKIYGTLSLLIMSILLATAISFVKYHLSFNFLGFSVLLKILLGMGIFVAIYHITKTDVEYRFQKKLIWAFALPTLLLIPFLFATDLAQQWKLFSTGYRFMGFTVNPGGMSSLAIVAYSYFYSFLIFSIFKEKNMLRPHCLCFLF